MRSSQHPPRRLRVLVVGPTMRQPGGVGMFNEILLNSPLREQFCLRHLDTSRPPQYARQIGRFAPINLLLFAQQLVQLLILIIGWRPQIMHEPITDGIAFFKESAFMGLARIFGVRVIGHLHGNGFVALASHPRPEMRWLVRRAMRLPNVIIALSEGWEATLRQLIAPDLKIVVLPNTVTNDIAARACIERPERADPRFQVLFLGSLGERKGVPDILKAAALVRQQQPEIQFILAGPPEAGAVQGLIREAQERPAGTDNLRFAGLVTGTAKVRLLRESNVLILPSYAENFPIVVLEALAAGLALIVTPVGALAEVLESGRNCLFVTPGDYSALAQHIVWLAQHPNICRAMGDANQALFREQYAPEVVFERLGKLYRATVPSA
ncbi:MAG TPA: glycosyltransferase family 4 protein [Phototrophicaceae bacterium]|nr:glycosyltransferase family 4 protein [Phototrophicaceae bacterium]